MHMDQVWTLDPDEKKWIIKCTVTIIVSNYFFSSDVLPGLRIVLCQYTVGTPSLYTFFDLHAVVFITP